tara:strand:- start:814 stop:1251 length:438 start_codon:yes stop_codon:yes gene_type:complete
MPEREFMMQPEDEKLVHEIYEQYQKNNQTLHDQARTDIATKHQITEEEAEAHPEMEDRFEQLRANMAMQNSGVTSINPDTGEEGKPVPKATPQYVPPVQTYDPPPSPPSTSDVFALENLVRNHGFKVLQSATDHAEGIITLVITR